jgi:hypothetical protein
MSDLDGWFILKTSESIESSEVAFKLTVFQEEQYTNDVSIS